MTVWKPRASPLEHVLSLDLTAREGYVLSQIDGATAVEQLAQVTGLKPAELSSILERLVGVGAIEPAPDPRQSGKPQVEPPVSTHRQLFETQFHSRSKDERAQLASVAEDPALSALCFDPVPAVIHRVLENPRTGLDHARLIAAHHGNPAGLEELAARASFLQDREVQRLLMRNSQSPETVVRRILAPRRLAEIYLACQNRELPERHRRTAHAVLRSRFAAAAPEERVDLILTTEGRALGTLSGLALDGRSVSLLCSRGLSSMLLVENLAHWPATPPALIAHLLKQPLVRQTPALKLLLRRHANCPRSAP